LAVTQPRIIFAGTPDFALATLETLVDNGYVPVAVLTQPDRPAGRGKRMTDSPVKRFASRQGISLLQPPSLRNDAIVAVLQELRADVMIVAAYGLILPQTVLDIPHRGCVNVHASLLPRWRGAAPIQAAILANDATTGISLMQMTAGLDCGPLIASEEIAIAVNETAGELHDRLAPLGGTLLCEHLPGILVGEIDPQPQNEAAASYAGKIRTLDAELDWRLPAGELERRVRAYDPVPGAYFFARDVRVKCWQAKALVGVSERPGTVLEFDASRIVIACDDGALRLESLQLPGKRRVTAKEFVAQIDLRGQVLSD
jgi:methionyl-tRNA formyltransferase